MNTSPIDDDPAVKAMRLRADPPRPLRLSRKAALAGGAVLITAVAAATGVGLLKTEGAAPPVELARVSVPPPEAVRALPGDYDAPQLGPPLPGDLARPILRARTTAEADGPASATPSTPAAVSRAAEARHAELERRRIEAETARTSTLLLLQGASSPGSAQTPPSAASAANPGSSTPAVIPSLLAGTIIEASLVTGVRSDLPGTVLGQITADVHDSLTGHRLIIPKGSRLIGAHSAQVAQGQSRLQILWSRLILPNGQSISLEDQAASDPQGYSGLQDRTDQRWGERLRYAALTTLLAVSGAAVDVDAEDRFARSIRDGAVGGVDTLGRGLVERGLSLPPRLTLRPGFGFRIILTQDLALQPYGD
jgi:type IV secretory pathway VirB10-like protein